MSKKVAYITGGGAGMGKATAFELSGRGFAVSILDLKLESAEKTAAEIIKNGGEALAFAGDISSKESQKAAIDSTVSKYGRLDAVFANAGEQLVTGDVLECKVDKWRYHMDVNLTGTYLTAHLTLPHLIRTKGALLATSSDAGVRPARAIAAYNVSKTAVIAIMKSIALDFGDRGVRANVICPGNIETEHLKNEWEVDEEVEKAWKALVPMGRYGQPEEIAKVAAHLLTDESSYTSGLVYRVDGAASVGYYPMMVW